MNKLDRLIIAFFMLWTIVSSFHQVKMQDNMDALRNAVELEAKALMELKEYHP